MKSHEYDYICQIRLSRLRACLKENGFDSFLVILGIDSRFNAGCYEAVKYLLCPSELCIAGAPTLEYTDDFVMLINMETIYCFCTKENVQQYLKNLFFLPNVVCFRSDSDDPDKCEDMKVQAFKLMVNKCQKIAIPYSTGSSVDDFELSKLEGWPLIQSFACNINDTENRSFFTLTFQVRDFSAHLNNLKRVPDLLNLEDLQLHNILLLCWSFEACLQKLDTCRNPRTDETTVLEPLLTLFKHSKLRGSSSLANYSPFVRIGKESIQEPLTASHKELDDKPVHLVLGGCSPVVNAYCTRTYMLERSGTEDNIEFRYRAIIDAHKAICVALSTLVEELEQHSFQHLNVAIESAKNMIARKLNSLIYQKINVEAISENPQLPLSSRLVVLRAEIVNLTDAENVTFGSVSYADTFLLTEVTLNREVISTKLTNLTKEVLPFGHWGKEAIEPLHWSRLLSRKCSVSDCELPVAVVFHGVGQIALIQAVCKFDSGKIHLYGDRLGSYDYAVKQLDYFSTDSTDFWSLWQCYIDEASNTCESSGSGCCNPHAFFEFSPEECLNLYQNLGIYQKSQITESAKILRESRSVFFIIYRGSASHECLLALKGHSKVGVLERTEVARIGNMHYQLESILSNRTDKESSAAFPFLDGAIMTLKNRNTSLNVLKDVLASTPKHLEASDCFSMCGGLNMRPGQLLRGCGIYPITVPTREEEDVTRLIEKLGLSKEVAPDASVSGELASTEYIAQSRLQRFGLGDTPETNTLSLTILCGLHGSHMEDVYKNVLSLSQNAKEWIIISTYSLTDVRKGLESSIELMEESKTDRRHRFLLVAPEFVSPIKILSEIANFCESEWEARVSLKIVSVISCVNLRMCLMGDEGFILPGLRAFFEQGWSNVILFTSPTSEPESDMQDAVTRAIRLINPRAIIMSAPNGRIKDMGRFDSLLTEDAFDDPKLQRHRLLTFPQLYPDCGAFRLMDLQVTFTRRLDRKKWNSALSALRLNLSPFSENPLVLRIKANVGFSEEAGHTYSISYYSQSDAKTERVSSYGYEKNCFSEKESFSVTATFLVSTYREVYPKLASGCGQKSVEMLTEWLKDWLRSAAPQQSLPKEPLSAEKLTPAMLEEIHELYHLCPLPPGWYYTGSQYVHMNGEKSFKHPCFEQFLKEHVEEENARIAKFNKYLVNHPIPDMFS
uniref:Uncharacterized protein C20orf194 n=1 Tax=Schistocephalus solidus TaxID=70667 RepID=A0A0X3PSX7_SCHSO